LRGYFIMERKKSVKKIESIKKKIIPILKKNKVSRAGIFGSYARGEETKDSDVDILVEFNGSLLDLVDLEIGLRKILKKKVDLLTYAGISPYLQKRILDEEVRIV